MKSVKQLFDLKDKIAIITGGAGFLGEKHAEAIAEFGGIPILLDVNKKVGTEKANRISDKYQVDCEYIDCDITQESQILEVKEVLLNNNKSVEILINNAAINPKVKSINKKNFSRLENFKIEQWNIEISVGLTSSMLCSKIFGHEMAKKNRGVILNISSDLGIIAPDQRLYKQERVLESEQPVKPVTYSVIKHGLIGLTKYLATYWGDKGVRCNALCPGGIYDNQPDDFVTKISNLIPLGRMAHPDEYKAAVVFLVSEASSYMNGGILTIDGGRSTW
mgnify:CR=1 FL=1